MARSKFPRGGSNDAIQDPNRFSVLQGGVDPIGALSKLTDNLAPQAAKATAALTGKPVKGQKPETEAVEGDDSSFKKGFLKGIDKSIFLGMLGDALTAIGGGESQGLTKQAIEGVKKRQELNERSQELAKQRAHDAEMAAARLEVDRERIGSSEKLGAADIASRENIARMRITADRDAQERAVANEKAARDQNAVRSVETDRVNEAYKGTSLYVGFDPPAHLTPESVLKSEKNFREFQEYAAPFHERDRLMKLEQSGHKKMAEDMRKIHIPHVNQTIDLIRQGKEVVIDPESGQSRIVPKTTILTDPKTGEQQRVPIGTLQDQIRRAFSAMEDVEVMRMAARPGSSAEKLDLASAYLDDLHNMRVQPGETSSYHQLSDEEKSAKDAKLMRMILTVIDAEHEKRMVEVRERLLQEPKLEEKPDFNIMAPVGPVPGTA